MRKLAILGFCSILAACGGGSSSSSNSSGAALTASPSVAQGSAFSYWDTGSSFSTPAMLYPTVTVSGSSASEAFSGVNFSVNTVDGWANANWTSGVTGSNNAEHASGNFLRACSASTAPGTTVAVSQNLNMVTDLTKLAGVVFDLQDCTVNSTGSLKTWTFDPSNGSFTSSTGPTTVPQAAVTAMFATYGFNDTSISPAQTTYAKAYSYVVGSQEKYFLVIRNTDGTTNRVLQGISRTTSASTQSSTSALAQGNSFSVWDTANNFNPSTTLKVVPTITGAGTNSVSMTFKGATFTVATTDSWNGATWTGLSGNNNSERANGNFLRACSASTAAGTALAISDNVTVLSDRTELNGKVFDLQNCTVSSTGSLKTWTFNSDGSFVSSTGPTTASKAAVDAMFSASGFVDTSTTPTQTTYVTAYSYTYSGGKAYYLAIRNTDGTTNNLLQGVAR